MAEADILLAVAPENNVVVHAAAGTGKTHLLNNRIIRLLLAGCPPGAILAITFTRKAAGEISQRLTGRLHEFAEMDLQRLQNELAALGASTDAATLARARDLYEIVLQAVPPLRATTFHAFCQDILHRFPLEAGVSPGFSLLETTNELELQAWHALDAEMTADPTSALAQAMDLLLRDSGGYDAARRRLTVFLQYRNDWWSYVEGQDDAPTYAAGKLRSALGITAATDPVTMFHADADVTTQIRRYAHLMSRHSTVTNEKLAARLIQAGLPQTTPAQAFALVRDAVLTQQQQPRVLRASNTLIESLGSDGTEELLRLHQQLIDRVCATLEQQRRNFTLECSQAWYVCGQRFLDHYQRLKQEQGVLDFTDLEWETCKLLNRSQHAEWVQYKLDQRIDHLLVDEFQDTNPTQWRLLLPLLREMAAGGPHSSRSVFLVGDEKQSVYRFRRADPDLFRTAHTWLTEHANAHSLSQRVSWRSSPAIIRFVNLIFSDNADESYVLNAFEAHATRHDSLWGVVEVLPLVSREHELPEPMPTLRDPLRTPRIVDEDRRHRQEADLIAARIRDLLGMPILSKPAGADNETRYRPLGYGDILILLRDRQYAHSYEDALRRANIPYLGSARGQLLTRLEIRDLTQLLKLLAAPFDNLALASVLRSPLFDASDADLMRLAGDRDSPPASWYARLLRLSPPRSAALDRARRLLPGWMDLVDRIPVHDLLDRVYAEGDVLGRYLAAAPAHLRTRVAASLTRFLDLALDVDSGRYPSLARFLTRLQALSQDDTDNANDAVQHDIQRVRILTIHAAKGLESPVVFLADSARETERRDRGDRVIVDWPATAPRPRHFHVCSQRDAPDEVSQRLYTYQKQAAHREETNLLYVALTRARQMLFISGCEPARGHRGWYGFLERRLRDADASGTAATAGMQVEHRRAPDDKSVHNTCGRLVYGAPPTLAMPTEEPLVAPPTVDEALRHPIPIVHTRVVERPSDAEEDNRSTAVHDSLLAQRRGVVLHRMLELLTLPVTDTERHTRLTHEFPDLHDQGLLSDCWCEARAVFEAPAFRFLFDARHYQEAYNEVPLLYRDQDRDVYGVIDRLLLTQDAIVLVDYKTHVHATPDNTAALARAYFRQMHLYGEGVRRLWPEKRLKLLLLFTACSTLVDVPPAA